jgi:hypothetical protein
MARKKRIGSVARIGELAEEVLRRSDRSGGFAGARVCAAWESVAGPAVAAHSRAVRVTEGELLVAVDSPAWANELALMSGSYLAELHRRVGKDSVRAIRFTVSRSARSRTSTKPERRHRQPVALPSDEEVRAALTEVPESISDPALKEAIARALAALRKAGSLNGADTARDQR